MFTKALEELEKLLELGIHKLLTTHCRTHSVKNDRLLMEYKNQYTTLVEI